MTIEKSEAILIPVHLLLSLLTSLSESLLDIYFVFNILKFHSDEFQCDLLIPYVGNSVEFLT